MSVSDTYDPVPPIACPWCNSAVTEWQGKDGPRLFLHFRQGQRHPVADRSDENWRIDPSRLNEFVLPEEFDLLGLCLLGHNIPAVGRCLDGVWSETDISMAEEQAAGDAARERARQVRESLGY